MKKLLLTGIAALLLATGAAHAQRESGVSCGFSCIRQGYPPGSWRPINVSPTTGRTYSTEADYRIQRRSKRK
jgi:hypothetical protein